MDEAPSAELTSRIQGLIDAWQPQGWVQRACKVDYNALPLHSNLISIWCLQPDGTVFSWDHESFSRHEEPETDPLVRFAVLLRGAREYPDLQELVPEPPPHARECDSCGGTGEAADCDVHWCYGCNGLGWIVQRSSP
jgi:hypothetical protein